MASCSLFMVLSSIPLILVAWRIVGKKAPQVSGVLLVASVLLSGMLMYSFERGCMIVVVAVATLLETVVKRRLVQGRGDFGIIPTRYEAFRH